MLDNAPHLNVGDVTQINTRGYNRSGSSTVNVGDGGQYSNNTEIHAGVYQEIRGDDPSLNKLYAHVSAGCMHNSADRLEAPKCHEDTRKAVQGDIFSWIDDGRPDEVLWLTGPAGTGKSAIMGTVADKLKEKGRLSAAYYLSSFAGSLERKSKQGFVTTLAYQLRQCEGSGGRVSQAILDAVKNNPAVFRMTLKEQMERLVLRPLRGGGQARSKFRSGMVILVDGIDECGEDRYDQPGRSRQGDQVEVLSALIHAIMYPAFPFRIVIASRPETWIRSFFAEGTAGKVTEIDDKYSPDNDIRLFFKSKFSELCRRYGLNPSTWPAEADIDKLVEDASGQFIYVATVIRFVDTAGTLAQAQLEIVLSTEPRDKSTNPFSTLDALYTVILRSSLKPEGTVLWLKALHHIQQTSGKPSAWTVDRLFETSAGQAQMLLTLPSLVYVPNHEQASSQQREELDMTPLETDSEVYGDQLNVPLSLIPNARWNTGYAFYHKSFLDYLENHSRCGNAFPDIGNSEVEKWIWGRLAISLNCGGPEVSINEGLLLTFKRCVLGIIARYTRARCPISVAFAGDPLANSQPSEWLAVAKELSSSYDPKLITTMLFIFVHASCRWYHPCSRACKRWRKAIADLPKREWNDGRYSSLDLLLDRFCIKRLGRVGRIRHAVESDGEQAVATRTSLWLPSFLILSIIPMLISAYLHIL